MEISIKALGEYVARTWRKAALLGCLIGILAGISIGMLANEAIHDLPTKKVEWRGSYEERSSEKLSEEEASSLAKGICRAFLLYNN